MVGVSGQCRMVDFLYLRVCGEEIQDFQGVLHVAFHPQGQGFQPLKKDEGIERTDGSSRVAQQCGADTGDIGSRACRVGETNAVVAGIRLGELRKFPGGLPVEFSGVHDDASQ